MAKLLSIPVRSWCRFCFWVQDELAPDTPRWAGLLVAVFGLGFSTWLALTTGDPWPLALGGTIASLGFALWWPWSGRGSQ